MRTLAFSAALVVGALIGIGTAAPAQAKITITYGAPGDMHSAFSGTEVSFDDYTIGASADGALLGGTLAGGAIVEKGSAFHAWAAPLGDTSAYLAVQPGETETLSFTSHVDEFGFYWGSIDTFNKISFYDGDKLLGSFSGGTLPKDPGYISGSQTSYAANRYVNFYVGTFTKVVLTSTSPAFELDNIAVGAPEPATWATMLLGFGLVGMMMRHRNMREGTSGTA